MGYIISANWEEKENIVTEWTRIGNLWKKQPDWLLGYIEMFTLTYC